MIRPLADRVVIEPKAAETQTASGLFIPDTAKEKPQQGTVVAAGPGKKDEPMEVKVGDVVIYGKYAAFICLFIKINGNVCAVGTRYHGLEAYVSGRVDCKAGKVRFKHRSAYLRSIHAESVCDRIVPKVLHTVYHAVAHKYRRTGCVEHRQMACRRKLGLV